MYIPSQESNNVDCLHTRTWHVWVHTICFQSRGRGYTTTLYSVHAMWLACVHSTRWYCTSTGIICGYMVYQENIIVAYAQCEVFPDPSSLVKELYACKGCIVTNIRCTVLTPVIRIWLHLFWGIDHMITPR